MKKLLCLLTSITIMLTSSACGKIVITKDDDNNTIVSISENDGTDNDKEEEIKTPEKQEPTKPVNNNKTIKNVSEEVEKIRDTYYYIQNNINSFQKYNEGNIVKYYSENMIQRIDIPSGTKDEYTRYYYFSNNKPIFVFKFNGEKENRLYFKNGILFRWVDENGVTHDNDITNKKITKLRNETLKYLNEYYKPGQTPVTQTENQAKYRVRKSANDANSQIGAFAVLENAKALADNHKNDGYKVYDMNGNIIYTP